MLWRFYDKNTHKMFEYVCWLHVCRTKVATLMECQSALSLFVCYYICENMRWDKLIAVQLELQNVLSSLSQIYEKVIRFTNCQNLAVILCPGCQLSFSYVFWPTNQIKFTKKKMFIAKTNLFGKYLYRKNY